MITTQTELNRQQTTATKSEDPQAPAPLPNLSDRDKRKLNDYLFVHKGDLTATARGWGCLEVEVIAYLEHPLITPYLAALGRLKREADCRAALDTLRETLAAPELTPAHAERRRAATAILRHHQQRPPRTPRAQRQQPAPTRPAESTAQTNATDRSAENTRHRITQNATTTTTAANNVQQTTTAAHPPANHHTGGSSFAAQSGDT